MTERRAGWEEMYEVVEAGPAEGKQAPVIGVFDSGFGGLTVLKALLKRMPEARYAFLGDTARLPYGSKSQRTIARYASESAQFLVEEQGAEFLVIACNTASALALGAIREAVSVPVLGVIEPGAAAASASSRSKDVAVIATEATVASHAYLEACRALGLRAVEKACPLLVPLVEEGWIDSPVTAQVVRIYLDEVLALAQAAGERPDTLVLGCTHYPLLRPIFEKALPAGLRIIDSAEATADEAARLLGYAAKEVATFGAPTAAATNIPRATTTVMRATSNEACAANNVACAANNVACATNNVACAANNVACAASNVACSTTNVPRGAEYCQNAAPSVTDQEDSARPQIRCFATDSVEKFERLGSRFLGLAVGKVELVDLGG